MQRGKDIISRQVVWLCARVQAATTEREQLMSPAGACTHDRLRGAARAAGDVTKRQQTKKDLAAFVVEFLEGGLQAIKVAQKVNALRVKRPHRVPCACATVQMSFLDGETQGAECEDGPVGTPPTFVGGSRCSTRMQPADLKSPIRCRPPPWPCKFDRWIIISRRLFETTAL